MADRLPRLSQGGGRGRPYFDEAGWWAGPFNRRRGSTPACKDTDCRPNLGENTFFPSPLSTPFLPSLPSSQSLYLVLFLATPNQFALHFKAGGECLSFYVFICEEAVKP